MLYALYLFALAFGSVFTLASIFSGFLSSMELEKEIELDKDLSVDHDHELSVDKSLDLAGDLDVEVGDGVGFSVPDVTDPQELHELIRLNVRSAARVRVGTEVAYRPWGSFRFYTAAAQFFGLTGFLFTWLAVSQWLTLGLSITMGLLAGVIVTYALYYTNKQGGDPVEGLAAMVGLSGTVVLPVAIDKVGSVNLVYRGGLVELPCKTQEEQRMPTGAEVIVYATDNDYLYVAPMVLLEEM